jgi:hypothetical protein
MQSVRTYYMLSTKLKRYNRGRVFKSSASEDENRGHIFSFAHQSMHVRVNTTEKHYPERHGTSA